MAEGAFERFRRLRSVAQPVSVHVQAQQTEGEVPLSPLALLLALHERGVALTPYPGGRVRCRAPQGAWTPALLEALHMHQAVVVDLLEELGERAAILEYDGGLAREDAERLAWDCLLRKEQ